MVRRPRVIVTRQIPSVGIDMLRTQCEVEIADPGEDNLHDESSLVALAQRADGLITMLSDPITEAVISELPERGIVAQFAVGYDNIDVDSARRYGVVVTNTPGVLTDATADFAIALLLAVARKIVPADAYVREGRFTRWETMTMLGMELRGQTLGILGLGRIGAAVARRALGFGLNIIYHNRRQANPTVERETGARYVDFPDLLTESDILTIHTSLNQDSRGLFDAAAFARMKRGAILINTSRGSVIVEDDLVTALTDGVIAGAGLDVFQEEPAVHPELLRMENVVLSPHLGSATVKARERMSTMCAESVVAHFFGDDKIPHRVA